jgi:cbb3-type cytochrome oxidase subunit 3
MSESELIAYKVLGMVIFMSIFFYAAFYAYRPKNKRVFEELARLPLED